MPTVASSSNDLNGASTAWVKNLFNSVQLVNANGATYGYIQRGDFDNFSAMQGMYSVGSFGHPVMPFVVGLGAPSVYATNLAGTGYRTLQADPSGNITTANPIWLTSHGSGGDTISANSALSIDQHGNMVLTSPNSTGRSATVHSSSLEFNISPQAIGGNNLTMAAIRTYAPVDGANSVSTVLSLEAMNNNNSNAMERNIQIVQGKVGVNLLSGLPSVGFHVDGTRGIRFVNVGSGIVRLDGSGNLTASALTATDVNMAVSTQSFSYDVQAQTVGLTQSFAVVGADQNFSIGGILKVKGITGGDSLAYTITYTDIDNAPQTLTYKNGTSSYFTAVGNYPMAAVDISAKGGTSIVFTVALPNSSGTISYNIGFRASYIANTLE